MINDSKECMFEKVTSIPSDDANKEDVTNELLLRTAIAALQKAQITGEADNYAITIECRQNKLPNKAVSLYPLGCEGKEAVLTDGMAFTGLSLISLTEFYVISIDDLRRVIKLPTEGMPMEKRDNAIFRSYINTKGKFINYLAFMLTDDVEQYVLESQQLEKELSIDHATALEQQLSTSLYEDMVRMAYTNPERIASIRQIIEKVDKEVVPDHFMEMYQTFENVLKQIKRL